MVVFVVIAFTGVVFLIVSAIFGGDHEVGSHEISFEHGLDHDVDHGWDGGGGVSPLSLRVIAIFLTSAGSVGAICRYYNLSYPISAFLGAVGGLIFAALGWQILRLFYKQQATSTVTSEDLTKADLAEVKTAIPASGIGQICVIVKGQRQYLPARAHDGNPIGEGASVKIMACPGGDAVIVRKI